MLDMSVWCKTFSVIHACPRFLWERSGEIDDYAEDGGPGEVRLLCSFYHEPLRTWIEMNVNMFAISNYTALKLDVQDSEKLFEPICEYELYILPNKKVSTTKNHGKNYMKGRPPLVRHL